MESSASFNDIGFIFPATINSTSSTASFIFLNCVYELAFEDDLKAVVLAEVFVLINLTASSLFNTLVLLVFLIILADFHITVITIAIITKKLCF